MAINYCLKLPKPQLPGLCMLHYMYMVLLKHLALNIWRCSSPVIREIMLSMTKIGREEVSNITRQDFNVVSLSVLSIASSLY